MEVFTLWREVFDDDAELGPGPPAPAPVAEECFAELGSGAISSMLRTGGAGLPRRFPGPGLVGLVFGRPSRRCMISRRSSSSAASRDILLLLLRFMADVYTAVCLWDLVLKEGFRAWRQLPSSVQTNVGGTVR